MVGGTVQQVPPASTLKNASMSASVPMSPSPLKSAVLAQGAAAELTVWKAAGAWSSSTVWQKLLPLLLAPPGRLMSVTCVPAGLVSVMVRSPTKEWSRPTVVAPCTLVQEDPSKRKLRSEI